MYTTTLTVDTRIHGELVPAGTRVQIDDSRFPSRIRLLSGGRWRPVSQARLSADDIEIDGQAITALN